MEETKMLYILQGIGAFAWKGSFTQFCKICNLDPQSNYAQNKWERMKDLVEKLNTFDLGEFAELVKAGHSITQQLSSRIK